MSRGRRLTVRLAPEHGEKLFTIAKRTGVREATLAGLLLAQAIDAADPSPESVVALLDRISGAWKRIEAGADDAHEGRTIPFDRRL